MPRESGWQSRRFQPKEVAVRLPAHGVEKHVPLHLLAAFEFGENAVALLVDTDARDFFAQPKCSSHLAQVVGKRFHDLAIDEIQHNRALIDQGDLGAHRGHERGVFEAHDARTHHDDFARKAANAREFVRIEDALAVEGNIGAARGARAAGDQYVLAAQRHFIGFALHFDRVRIGKLRHSLEHGDAVAPELRADHVRLAGDDALDAGREILNRNVSFPAVAAAVESLHGDSRKLKNGLADALARDRSRVHAHAAHHHRAVDDRDALAQLGGADGALLARRAAADDDQIVGLVVHYENGQLSHVNGVTSNCGIHFPGRMLQEYVRTHESANVPDSTCRYLASDPAST